MRICGTIVQMSIAVLLSAVTSAVAAQSLFQDGFESGDLSHTENGISWFDSVRSSVATANPQAGTYALAMTYQAAADGQDSWTEQRFHLTQCNETWLVYNLFLPANYYHRSQSGPANNKFLAMYRNPYGTPGFQINISLEPNGTGGSDLEIHKYSNGVEGPVLRPQSGINFFTATDLGRWHEIIVHVKVPTSSSSNDGVVQMWKDGRRVADENGLADYGGDGNNYMDEGYLLGWSNSGFAQDTVFYIDNFSVYDAPPEALRRPSPPTLSVQ